MNRTIQNYFSGKGGTRSLKLSKQLAEQNKQTIQNQIAQNETAKAFQESANNSSKQTSSSSDFARSLIQGPLSSIRSNTNVFEGKIYSQAQAAQQLIQGKLFNQSPGSFSSFEGKIIDFKSVTDGLKELTSAIKESTKVEKTKIQTQTGGGGGGGGNWWDTKTDFFNNFGDKRTIGQFKYGVMGGAIEAGGRAMVSGVDAYLNYQRQMATAPIETYSNIASLQGFQQKRFLRDFADFSPEALVLRNTSFRYNQQSITDRIDKIATETSRKKDTAETNIAIKESLVNVLSEVKKGAIGGGIGGGTYKDVGLGAAVGLGAGITQEAASALNNPALMRTGVGKFFAGDLYLKNRTGFDTENIIANTRALENAEIEKNQISIAIQREYQKTIGARIGGYQTGRVPDLLKEYSNQSYLKGRTRVTNRDRNISSIETEFSEQEVNERLAESAEFKRKFDPSVRPFRVEEDIINSPQFQLAQKKYETMAGVTSQSAKLNKTRRELEQDTGFVGVLQRMGYAMGDVGGVDIMSKFANIGGAGAGKLTNAAAPSLERARQISLSGFGTYGQVLDQAGLVGRLGGIVKPEDSMKKFEEVLSRAVAIGMNNSELTSIFTQNVAATAGQMKAYGPEGISMMAQLVQRMQKAGGGQPIDFQKMQEGLSGFYQGQRQNEAVSAYRRSNMLNAVNQLGFTGEKAAIISNALIPMDPKEMASMGGYISKFLALKKGAARDKFIINAPNKIGNLLGALSDEDLRTLQSGGETFMGAAGAASATMSPARFKEVTGHSIQQYSKLSAEEKRKIAIKVQTMSGQDYRNFLMYTNFMNTKDAGLGNVVNPEDVAAGTAAGAQNTASATSRNAQQISQQNQTSLFTRLATEGAGASFGEIIQNKGNKFGNLPNLLLQTFSKPGELQKAEQAFRGDTKMEDYNKYREMLNLTQEQIGLKEGAVSVEGRPTGTSEGDAAATGQAFASAFFTELDRRGGSIKIKAGSKEK